MKPTVVDIKRIRMDGGTQPRAQLDQFVIDGYAEAMRDGVTFPPPVVFYDGKDYWLADGFHRTHAVQQVGQDSLACEVRQGTRRDAVLFSVGANSEHGLPRTNADKRRAVETLLGDVEWVQWSDREIARRCSVNNSFVSRVRTELSVDKQQIGDSREGRGWTENGQRKVMRGGTVYTQKTANIGTSARIAPDVRDKIRHTALIEDREEVAGLAQLSPPKQAAVADLLLSGQVSTVAQGERHLAKEEKRQDLVTRAAAAPKQTARPWQIINGDCLDELSKLAAGSFRLIFADPPYNIGVDYGGGEREDLLPEEQFVAWCGRWIDECVRLLTPDGSLWLLTGDEYADHTGLLLRRAGLHRRSWVKWYETFGVNCSNNFNRCSRHLFYCVKDPGRFVFNADAVSRPSDRQAKYGDKRADPGGKIWDNVWTIPRLVGTAAERIPDFPTQLPLDLVRPIVLCASDPGDSVLDPFNGSATTGVAAITTGRRYVGVEKSPTFARLAELRLAASLTERMAS